MTDTEELSRLDDLILEEKRNIARAHFFDVWESAIAEGIDVEIIADALITGVLVELARKNGHDTVHNFVAGLGMREAAGDFFPDRILQ